MTPLIKYISRDEFEKSEDIFKIISHEINNTFAFFELLGKKYYIGWPSSDIIKVDLVFLEKEKYLLVGVDLKVVVLDTLSGRIIFSMGLFSYFKGFRDSDELSFTIFSELADISINKNNPSISQVIMHDLEF